jgi:hypothetical protein
MLAPQQISDHSAENGKVWVFQVMPFTEVMATLVVLPELEKAMAQKLTALPIIRARNPVNALAQGEKSAPTKRAVRLRKSRRL